MVKICRRSCLHFAVCWLYKQTQNSLFTHYFALLCSCIVGSNWLLEQSVVPISASKLQLMRKGLYSVLLQDVRDHRMASLAIGSLSSYGRGQDGTLLPGWIEQFEGVEAPLLKLGDAACPLLPWLTKPFPEGRGITEPQTQFNCRHSQARTPVERAFGRPKCELRSAIRRGKSQCTTN